jgi:hypothetical protein
MSYHDELKDLIKNSSTTIYEKLDFNDEKFLSVDDLRTLLAKSLIGVSFSGLPIRTRSKEVKKNICSALGYPVPSSFKKTQPRFLAQNFDIYVQKSSNLQIWNEEIQPDRRYVIIALNSEDTVTKITVVSGNQLAEFDKTGAITKKYQAQFSNSDDGCSELVSKNDTENLSKFISSNTSKLSFSLSPSSAPACEQLLPISELFQRLLNVVGMRFHNPGVSQERNRGAELHKLACKALGYSSYADNGQFPDIFHQLLEVKLQTSPTIDLGLALPSSKEKFHTGHLGVTGLSFSDIRYCVFAAEIDNDDLVINKVVVTTGKDFFSRFRQFEGRKVNSKIQLRLPESFFN